MGQGQSVESEKYTCQNGQIPLHVQHCNGCVNPIFFFFFFETSRDVNFQTITVMYKSIHFWNGNESESPILISNFTQIADFLRKWQKSTF